jgi:hypothetical protein
VLVGLGETAGAVTVQVLWPAGTVEEWQGVSIDRWVTLKEGTGTMKEGTGALAKAGKR